MTETTAAPAEADTTDPPGRDWGRLLDAAGFIAGILLIVIVADIWTDGRLISRHLHKDGDGDGQPAD